MQRRTQWSLCIAAIALCSFGVSFSSNPLPVLLEQKELRNYTGLIMAGFSVAALSFYLLGGYLTDRYGGQKVILHFLPIQIGCAALYGWADSVYAYMPLRILHGASYALVFPPLYALLREILPQAEEDPEGTLRRKINSATSGTEFLAGGLGYASGLWLVEKGSIFCWSLAGASVCSIGWILVFMVPASRTEKQSAERPPLRVVLPQLMERQVLREAAISIGFMVCHRVILSYLALPIGLKAGWVIILADASNFLSNQWVARMARRFGDYHVLRVSAILLMGSMGLLASHQSWAVYLAGILLGIAMRGNGTCVLQLVQNAASRGKQGAASSTRSFIAEGSIMLGNLYGAWITTLWGASSIWLASIPWSVLPLILIGRRTR